ncbi:MAG: hypothetical protein ACJASQ_000021 [Crocinitomicaceae bacterium]|jgi:hypothetical protein
MGENDQNTSKENVEFSFDKGKTLTKELRSQLKYDIDVFKSKLSLGANPNLSADDESLIKSFASNNLRNISYYEYRIVEETKLQNRYNRWTVGLAIAIPVLIFSATLAAGYFAKDNFNMIDVVTGSVTVLLASTLGAHKLITSWIEKRKYRASFHQAKVDLLNILFELINEYEDKALGQKSFANIGHEGNLSDDFVVALKKSIRLSREVVDTEAQNFFKITGAPSFDLSSTLETSMSSAKNLVKGLKSRNSDTDRLRKEHQTLQERKEKIEDLVQESQSDLVGKEAELDRLNKKEEWICGRIDALESINNPTPEQEAKIAELEVTHEKIEDEINQLHIDCSKLKSGIRYNQSKY